VTTRRAAGLREISGIDSLVRRLVFSLVCLVLVTGGAGIVSVVVVQRSLSAISDTLVPVLEANAAVLQDVADADSAVRRWVLSGDELAIQPYRDIVAQLEVDQDQLRSDIGSNQHLGEIARLQELAVEDWLSTYADERIAQGSKASSRNVALEALGWGKYERVRATNRELAQATDADLDAAMRGSFRALPWIFAAMVLVALLGGLALSVGRRIATQISSPLEGMQRVVDRWAAGEVEVRAVPSGPREVLNVAVALNSFADENARGRELQQRMLVQLTAADRAKSDFLSNVSHELRTPLTSIAGYLELLEEESTPNQSSMMKVVSRNVNRLRALIDDLLTLSSTESDPTGGSFRDVDLGILASEACFDLRTLAAGRSISLELDREPHPVVVQGDADQLSRAVLNLVSNAVKFSMTGGQIIIRVNRRDGWARFEVSDSGLGIPAEAMSNLGTRFYRAENAVSGEISGTGLGLRIVRAILDNHGGRLEIDSEEGAGTTARLLLPIVSETEHGRVVATGPSCDLA